jgi:signal transduction histidine kinase
LLRPRSHHLGAVQSVGNAVKVTAAGGRITLRVEARGSEILFSVSDNGAGIAAEDLKHVFERYWRSGGASYQGTGLAIAQGIVAAHGGKIWAESELGRERRSGSRCRGSFRAQAIASGA